MPFSVPWQIICGGNDATDRMNPFVEEIECSGKAGDTADSARIVFNDQDGQCIMPPKGTDVTIIIDGRKRFEGKTDAPEFTISRGGMMRLEVHCSGVDKKGKVKQAQRSHKDDATLKDFLGDVAKKAGCTITVDGDLGKIKRDYWSTRGMSFWQLGQVLADEMGATFKIRGTRAVFAKRGQGEAPGGGSTPSITVTRAEVIEARLKPFDARDRYTKARVRYYDRKAAKHKEKDVEIGDLDGGDVVDLVQGARADEASAGDAANGRKANSDREGGGGSITILLNVDAEVEGTCNVSGLRPGIDGAYRIESFRDRISRNGGAETELELKQPQGAAGTDDRKAGQ